MISIYNYLDQIASTGSMIQWVAVSHTLLLSTLFVLTFLLRHIDVQVSQLIAHLVAADHTNIVPELILLQELLGQVLQVPVRKCDM